MDNKKDMPLKQITALLPQRLQQLFDHLDTETKLRCEEIRLRLGQPPSISIGGKEAPLCAPPVTADELRDILSRAAQYSVHSYAETLKYGFVPLEGGHRLGVCGTASMQKGEITGIRMISSLNLRIAKEQKRIAKPVASKLYAPNGRLYSVLLISPPGFGKTTLLRDLIREISETGKRVGVADERGELAALFYGKPQFDLGSCTDVLDSCPKAAAVMMLVKTMTPEVVAMDEITSAEDVSAALYASHCGAAVLATAHAYNRQDLKLRPIYQSLMQVGIFERIVEIQRTRETRTYQVFSCQEEAECCDY